MAKALSPIETYVAHSTGLGSEDPSPIHVVNAQGRSSFLLTGDHAGNDVPKALNNLGLNASDFTRHIALDLGVRALGTALAKAMDITFIHQHYSRLVIDCNREPGSDEAMPSMSDGISIPGNYQLPEEARAHRRVSIHTPYHSAITDLLRQRDQLAGNCAIVALHSFTPHMNGVDRPWHIGILHNGGCNALALKMLDALNMRSDLVVGDNEPYRLDNTDFSIPYHALSQNRPYVEIEIRQDLIANPNHVDRWCAILSRILTLPC